MRPDSSSSASGRWQIVKGGLRTGPVRIRAQLFPYDAAWSIATLLEDLDRAKLIQRYEAEGKKCIQIINFTKHQNPHPKETTFGLPPCREITGKFQASRCGLSCIDYGLFDDGLSPPLPLSLRKRAARIHLKARKAHEIRARESQNPDCPQGMRAVRRHA